MRAVFAFLFDCATVSLAELASANVVGYQELAVPSGSSMRTATFQALAGDYKISDIKVSGAEGGGSDYAQKINADGSWGDTYYYLTEDGMGVDNGWYKDGFGDEPVSDEDTLSIGQAFIVTAGTDFKMTVAGQVISGQATVTAPAGFSIIGNPTPVEAKLSTITVSGAEGGGSDTAQKINADGSWGTMYYYLTEDGMGVDNGWYKDGFGDEPVTDEDALAPGESMIFTVVNELTLKFPATL